MLTNSSPSLSLPLSLSLSLLLLVLVLISPAFTICSTHPLCHDDDLRALLDIKRTLGEHNPFFSSWNDVHHPVLPVGQRATLHRRRRQGHPLHPPVLQPLRPHPARLRILVIVGNPALTGAIPASLGDLKHLTYLRISENDLITGPIPDSLCRLPKLEELRLSRNRLTGAVPACLGQNISVVDVSENRITDASALFGEGKKFRTLNMAGNGLEFDFSKVRPPAGLEELAVDHNRLTGTIPRQVAELEKLTALDVSYNQLCGPIPSAKYLKGLQPSSFAHNKCLCGAPLQPCRKY